MWKPIETAPTDGTHILVSRFPYDGGRAPTKIAWKHLRNAKRPGWRIGLNKMLRYVPTHWHPLPADI